MTRTATRPRSLVALSLAAVGLVVMIAAIVGVFVHQPTASPAHTIGGDDGAAPGAQPGSVSGGAATEADGVLPDGVGVFDDEYVGVAELDPELLEAVREAATDAAADGVEIHVNSGWRSRAYQEQLQREALAQYGSEEEAARWVASPDTSAHVTGDAIDVGPWKALDWLAQRGARYGLCQIYSNEPWHYELRPEAIESGCPAMFDDPTHDPDMQH